MKRPDPFRGSRLEVHPHRCHSEEGSRQIHHLATDSVSRQQGSWGFQVSPQAAGYDEYSLLYSTRDFFSLLVPYSEILLLGREASNGNESSNVSKLDVDNTPVTFSCIIQILFVSSNDKFGLECLDLVYFLALAEQFKLFFETINCDLYKYSY